MIETTRMTVFRCCLPLVMECYASSLEGEAGAAQHARERAEVTGFRQRISWSTDYTLWMIITTDKTIKPGTWEFDGRTYQIVDAQS